MKSPMSDLQPWPVRETRRAARVTALVLGFLLVASTAKGQVSGGESNGPQPVNKAEERWPERDRDKGVPLLLVAQPQGRPALQYALLPPVDETERGNPTVKYLMATASFWQPLKQDEYDLLDAALRNAPLADLDETAPTLKDIVNRYDYPLRLMKEGSRLEGTLDWESDVRTKGYASQLPSLGKIRELTNVLALQIRFDIKRHDWAAAREKLRTGFVLAEHLGGCETLIESLVGVAIATRLTLCLEDWVSEPGSPNIYWPLANLPAPFADMQRSMVYEGRMPYFSLPEMKQFREGHFTAQSWTSLLVRLRQYTNDFGGEPALKVLARGNDSQKSMEAAVLGALIYPQAKAFLVARGASAADVEKMPVHEALERYFLLSFEEESDEIFKWNGLPAREAEAGMTAAQRMLDKGRWGEDANVFAAMLLPSMSKARILGARLDRQIAALRIVEAIRSYAADKGALPETLAALAAAGLPVPADPVREAAFVYEVTDGKAVLSSPAATPREGLRYELTLRK